MKKISPIRVKLQVGGTFYDMSEFTPEEIADTISHVNAVQAIMDKHNNVTTTPRGLPEDDPEE